MSEKNVENLKEISTEALIEELCAREGIEKAYVGPYCSYEIKTKYEQDGNREVLADAVILINPHLGRYASHIEYNSHAFSNTSARFESGGNV